MPIKQENKDRYPKNWKEVRGQIMKRAKNKCEFCGKPHGETIMCSDDGHWYDAKKEKWRDKNGEFCSLPQVAIGQVKVILTVAHLDHTPENNDPENLRALCQRCHNSYDAEHRKETRKRTMAKKKSEAENNEGIELTTSTRPKRKTKAKAKTAGKKKLTEVRDGLALVIASLEELGNKAVNAEPKPELYSAKFDAEVKSVGRTDGGKVKIVLETPYSDKTWSVLGRYSGSVASISMVSKQTTLAFSKKQNKPTTQAQLNKDSKVPSEKAKPKTRNKRPAGFK